MLSSVGSRTIDRSDFADCVMINNYYCTHSYTQARAHIHALTLHVPTVQNMQV